MTTPPHAPTRLARSHSLNEELRHTDTVVTLAVIALALLAWLYGI